MFAEDRFFRNKPIYQYDKFENETSFEKTDVDSITAYNILL